MTKSKIKTETPAASIAQTELDLARNALSYDLQPYSSHPFAQTSPSRIGAIAKLFGLSPAPVRAARVLELGCSSGGNLIPLAAYHPNSQFVGIDISRTQVAAGRARIDQLGLKNIVIRCESFTECDPAVLGKFDYVIAHGVYSWVPSAVRKAMLTLIGQVLNENGVAYVSYNVLPGWRIPQTLRDVLLHIVPPNAPLPDRVKAARDAIRFIATTSSDQTLYGKGLREWAAQLENLPDDYVAHEFLEAVNRPCTVSEFLTAADELGLSFLGESDLPSMVPENAGPEAAESIRTMTGNNVIAIEQLMDLLNGRTFRQSLLVRHSNSAKIDRNLSAASLEGLHFSCDHSFQASDGDEGDLFTAVDSAGRTVTATSLLVGKALKQIQSNFPASATLASLCSKVGAKKDEDQTAVADLVLRLVLTGLLVPLLEPVDAPNESLTASTLSRVDALQGERFTTNAKHERVEIDPAARIALPALDGSNDQSQLTDFLAKANASGLITFSKDGKQIEGEAELTEAAKQVAVQVLEGLRRAGLMVAR